MKKSILILGLTALMSGGQFLSAQVGINNETPAATLDVAAQKTDGTTAEGFIAPRLTLAQLNAKQAQYGEAQTGASVYITDAT
ncbi:MAG: hypothetical protein LBS01_08150, partial [Prevotellaceae bacterium]|nr:hypothetical protein [Prevotellaceae bacterium]